jgi:hypothetical protein
MLPIPDGALKKFYVKLLMTPQSAMARIAPKQIDVLELIEELESITLDSDLKIYALRHLRGALKLYPEAAKPSASVEVTVSAEDTGASILKALSETALIDNGAPELRKGYTMRNGNFLALPRVSEYATRLDYFKAMQEYRLKIKADKFVEPKPPRSSSGGSRRININNLSPEDLL